MATSGTINVTAADGIVYRASWKITGQSLENNTSTISVTHSIVNNRTSTFGTTKTYVCSARIGSESTRSISKSSFMIAPGASATVGTTVHTITHNEDGTLTARLTVSITYEGSSKGGGADITFQTIQRRSTFTVPYGYAGSSVSITINKASDSFTHSLSFVFGGMSGSISQNTSESVVLFNLPVSMLSEFTDSISKTGRITCETYNNGNLIGTYEDDFTVFVNDTDEFRPQVSVSLSPQSSIPAKFSGKYVQGYSKVKADFTGSSAKNGASIESYSMSVWGVQYQGDVSDTLSSSGNVTVSCTVTDSRGLSTTVNVGITVLPYSKPAVAPPTGYSSVICQRCTSDGTLSSGGTYLRIRSSLQYSALDGLNTCAFYYRVGSGAWVSIGTDVVLQGVVSSVSSKYQVQMKCVDDISESNVLSFIVPTDDVVFSLREGGNGAAFGKYAEEENTLDINYNVKFRKPVLGLNGKLFSSNDGEITSGSDFNNYKSCGIYNCHETNCTNQPASSPGTLIVRTGEGDAEKDLQGTWIYLQQIYIPRTPSAIYMRHMIVWGTEGVWDYGKWYKFTGTQM